MARLFLVGTPIGNLGDLTLRAIETLRAVPNVAAEDTRRTRGLLSHLGITGKRLTSLEAHASARTVDRLLDRIEAGEDTAFVTDAGMPGVSDPGRALVARAAQRALAVTVVPGPSALSAAVALSGLVDAAFRFAGFPPRSGGKRKQWLASVAASSEPVVALEAPQRLHATLAELAERAPARAACVCREMTKLHEETVRGSLAELGADPREWRGECVLVMGMGPEPAGAGAAIGDAELGALADARLAAGQSVKQVAAALAAETDRSKRDLYAWLVRRRGDTS